MLRKTVALATLYLDIKHFKDENGVEIIDISQSMSGFPGSTEHRPLDWVERPKKDAFFGPVVPKNRRVKLEDLEVQWLKENWCPDVQEHGAIHTFAQSPNWVFEQVPHTLHASIFRENFADFCTGVGI